MEDLMFYQNIYNLFATVRKFQGRTKEYSVPLLIRISLVQYGGTVFLKITFPCVQVYFFMVALLFLNLSKRAGCYSYRQGNTVFPVAHWWMPILQKQGLITFTKDSQASAHLDYNKQ